MFTKSCPNCQKQFEVFPSKREKQFCSRSCYMSHRNRGPLNPSRTRDLSGPNNPMYGKGLKGADNPMYGKRGPLAPRWNGGRKLRKDGYVFVVVPDDHPFPSYTKKSGLKYVLEHRYLMEKHIGRYLLPGEVVHHIDGDNTNNSITNLMLLPNQTEHARLHRPKWLEKKA